jgi:hypothetical protein
VHVETRNSGFLVEPQNLDRLFLSGLASKPLERFSPVCPQNRWLGFGDFGLKINATVSWCEPQNQAGFGLLVAPQNRWRKDGVGHVSRSDGLLRLETSHGRVFQSDLKTDRGAFTDGARGTITDIALSPS